jgi:hypothetical protein
MKNKAYIFSPVLIILMGVFYFVVEVQRKNDTHLTNFSGEWKAKEPISIGGNIFCSYVGGDRMNSKTMKIVKESNLITIESLNTDSGAKQAINIEQLTLDGKESQMNHGQGNEKKSSVQLSDDGQAMTIKSIVNFMTATPYHVDVMKKASTSVTEVWKLSSDGKQLTIQAKAKSNIWDEERSWKTVFVRVN